MLVYKGKVLRYLLSEEDGECRRKSYKRGTMPKEEWLKGVDAEAEAVRGDR